MNLIVIFLKPGGLVQVYEKIACMFFRLALVRNEKYKRIAELFCVANRFYFATRGCWSRLFVSSK